MKYIFISMLFIFSSCKTTQKNSGNVLPDFIQKKIEQYQNEKVSNPPRSIYSYTYNNAKVYFIPAPCCDRMSELYDAAGTLLCNPDGGITGKGDGRCKDFFTARTNEELVWKDSRE